MTVTYSEAIVQKLELPAQSNKSQLQEEIERKWEVAVEKANDDIKNGIGEAFTNYISKNLTEANIISLLDGGEFENCDKELIAFEGLKKCIGLYAFAYYLNDLSVQISHTGAMINNPSHAQNLSSKMKIREMGNYRKRASKLLINCIRYIESEKEFFTTFKRSKIKEIRTRNRVISF